MQIKEIKVKIGFIEVREGGVLKVEIKEIRKVRVKIRVKVKVEIREIEII